MKRDYARKKHETNSGGGCTGEALDCGLLLLSDNEVSCVGGLNHFYYNAANR